MGEAPSESSNEGVHGRGADFRPLLGYCTNVHAGSNLKELTESLLKHAAAVKDRVSPHRPLPIGLWLSSRVAKQLIGDPGLFESFRDFLRTHGLRPFTFNAFPLGNFHAGRVKHRVYRPDWGEYERLEYTIAVASIAADLVEPGEEVSISTLPLGWGKGDASGCDPEIAAKSLRSLAGHLHRVEEETGRVIHVDLEPEPGCLLDMAEDVVAFFTGRLFAGGGEEAIRRHIRVCHDVCHSAVMFEEQGKAMRAYAGAGIAVGKVQLSSALRVNLEGLHGEARREALQQLAAFAEDRYLHQTMVRGTNGLLAFFEDLPVALEYINAQPVAECRVHFHVPVFARELGVLGTTSSQIADAVREAIDAHGTEHFEVETYAWGVMPAAHGRACLADGIAEELRHVRGLVAGVFES